MGRWPAGAPVKGHSWIACPFHLAEPGVPQCPHCDRRVGLPRGPGSLLQRESLASSRVTMPALPRRHDRITLLSTHRRSLFSSAHNGGVPTPSPPPRPRQHPAQKAVVLLEGRPSSDGVTARTRPLCPLGLQAQLRAGREAAGPAAPDGHPGTPEASLAFQGQTQTCVPAGPTPRRLPGWSTVTCAPHPTPLLAGPSVNQSKLHTPRTPLLRDSSQPAGPTGWEGGQG